MDDAIRWSRGAVSLLFLVAVVSGCGDCDTDAVDVNNGQDGLNDVRLAEDVGRPDIVDGRDGSAADAAEDTTGDADSSCPQACDQPPPATCDGNTRVDYDGEGTCTASTGACDYSAGQTRQDCTVADQICRDGECVEAPSTCDTTDNVAHTGSTLFDTTALSDESEPIRNGFDPLLQGDRTRIHVAVDRQSGAEDLRLKIRLSNLEFVAGSVLVNGQSAAATTDAGTVTVDLASALSSGSADVSLNADIASPRGIVRADVRLVTADGCLLPTSRSAIRLQVAGDIDPKGAGCLDMSNVRALQVTPDIPEKDTSVYGDRNGESSVYPGTKVLHQVTLCLQRSDARTVSLSGSADGTRPWMVDNHLLIETFDGNPAGSGQRTGAYITTATLSPYPDHGSLPDGTSVEVVEIASLSGEYAGGTSPSYFSFPSRVLQLDDYLPVGQPVWFRFTGLDSGVSGRLSRIFINAAEVDEDVPECLTAKDCPDPDVSAYGTGVAYAGGCVDGVCTQQTCSSDTACGAGQRCRHGYCTDGCSATTDCPGSQVCAGNRCVDSSTGRCSSYTDCAVGEVCQFGECVAGCYHPNHQQADYSDNYYNGFCQNNPDGCPRCGSASDTCWNNYCRDCEIDAHCSDGESCVQFRCVPN